MAYIDPARDVVDIYGLTLGKMLDLCVETPDTCPPYPVLWYGRPGLGFP